MSIDKIKDYFNNQPCNINYSSFPLNTKEYFIEPHIINFANFNNWKNKEVL